MGRIFYLMGKSATGKDTIYEALLKQEERTLLPVVPYTTRPMRANETEGAEYHFTDEKGLQCLIEAGSVIELREYHTVCGIWKYFTVDDEGLNLKKHSYLGIGVLESYQKLRRYFGEDKVIPIYVQVEDGLRLERALKREKKQKMPRYEEMCRRFLADQRDFSEEKLQAAKITRRFSNDGDRQDCIQEILAYIASFM